jgi:hypothetical protein
MKKIWLAVLLVLLMAGSSFAAWTSLTLGTTGGYPKAYDWKNGQQLIVFRVDCTSDANASGTIALSDLINTAFGARSGTAQLWRDKVAGSLFYALEWNHTGTITAPTIVVYSGLDSQLLSHATATTGNGIKAGNTDVGFSAPLTDLKFSSTTLGAAGVSKFYFWLIK